MDEIKDYIENGIIKEAFQAQFNLAIYKEIAENVSTLSDLSGNDKHLFPYIQRSAQSQMVLRTARIFDFERNYPTRCLDGLFKRVLQLELDNHELHNPGGLKKYLVELDYSPIPTSQTPSTKEFIIPFIEFCRKEIIGTKYKDEITLIKTLRNKYIAHNEAITESLTFNPEIVKTLTDIASSISTVIERSLLEDIIYLMDDDVRRNSYFIKALIKEKTQGQE